MRPKIAKKAEENKLFAKPVPKPGDYMAVPKKEDQRIAARLGSELVEGEGAGAYNEFLHQWSKSVSAAYRPPPTDDDCYPKVEVVYSNGHVLDVEPVTSCGPAVDAALREAVNSAPRPPMSPG